jgi:hypothetical protein
MTVFRQRLKFLKIELAIERIYKRLKIKFRNRKERKDRAKITPGQLKNQ